MFHHRFLQDASSLLALIPGFSNAETNTGSFPLILLFILHFELPPYTVNISSGPAHRAKLKACLYACIIFSILSISSVTL